LASFSFQAEETKEKHKEKKNHREEKNAEKKRSLPLSFRFALSLLALAFALMFLPFCFKRFFLGIFFFSSIRKERKTQRRKKP
jgi:hypothetical protein